MILFHCSRMNANITPYACGMNQTAQFACEGCNQEGKAPRGTAKRVPVEQHKKFVPEKNTNGSLAARVKLPTRTLMDRRGGMLTSATSRKPGQREGRSQKGEAKCSRKPRETNGILEREEGRATGKDAPRPANVAVVRKFRITEIASVSIPLWDRPHPCPGCKTIIKGHHYCRPCIRARQSDDPEKALAEVRRKRKAGLIHKGYPKGRLRRRVG